MWQFSQTKRITFEPTGKNVLQLGFVGIDATRGIHFLCISVCLAWHTALDIWLAKKKLCSNKILYLANLIRFQVVLLGTPLIINWDLDSFPPNYSHTASSTRTCSWTIFMILMIFTAYTFSTSTAAVDKSKLTQKKLLASGDSNISRARKRTHSHSPLWRQL